MPMRAWAGNSSSATWEAVTASWMRVVRGEVGLVGAAGHGALAVGLGDRDGLLLDGRGGLAGLLHLRVGGEQRERRGTLRARVGHREAAAVEDTGPRLGRLGRRAADEADGRLGEHLGDRRSGPPGVRDLALRGRAVRDPDLGQLGIGVAEQCHHVLHRAGGDLDVDAGLVGVDVLHCLADQVLHHGRGGQRDLLGDAVGAPGGVAVAAHGEECDEGEHEHQRESAHTKGLPERRTAAPDLSTLSGAVESS